MGINPITHCEVEAFQRTNLIHIPAFWVGVIMRIDDAIVSAVANRKPEAEQQTDGISVTDTAGLKAMFRGVAQRRRN